MNIGQLQFFIIYINICAVVNRTNFSLLPKAALRHFPEIVFSLDFL
jgi:hypothetical protein